MSERKKLFVVVVALFVVLGSIGVENSWAADVQNFSFVSSNPGGTTYNMVGGAVTLFNKEIPGVNFSVEASGGSVENARRVGTGEADFGESYSSHLHDAINGINLYEGHPAPDLRVLCEIRVSPHYFVTLKSSDIMGLKDLAGKRVSIGAPGSGTAENSKNVLGILGIEVETQQLSFAGAARAVGDGKIDALGQGGAPAAGIVELAASKDIRIIPYSDEELTKIVTAMPSYSKDYLPANTYKGQDQAMAMPHFHAVMFCNASVPEDVVYKVLKTMFSPEGKAYLVSVHKQWNTIKDNPEMFKALGLPYHPGAEKFWKEQGQ